MRLALTAAFALLLCNCSLRLPVEPYQQPSCATKVPSKEKKVDVWMHSDEYHTGLVFEYPWLLESGYIPPAGLNHPKQVVVSWGNTDAYSEEGISGPQEWFRVLFTPTPSVMELIPINRSVTSVMPQQRLWKAQFPADRGPQLAHFLNQCTRMDEQGKPIVVRPSSWGEGVQVESRFSYFIPRVCNIWSAQAIETLGGDIKPWRATTANSLARQLEKSQNGFTLIHDGTQ